MMYIFQVKPDMDLYVASNLRKREYFVRCPQRTLFIRKGGEWAERTEPVFAGYLFLEHPYSKPLCNASYYDICNEDGVIGFLKNDNKLAVLSDCEEQYIHWLWNYGKPITASHVYKTANGDCMILSGILREYGDGIISMDLRQRRARVHIPICGKDYKVTLPVIGV